MTLKHSWLIRVPLVADCLHTNMTQDCFHDSFSVETLYSQIDRADSVAKGKSPESRRYRFWHYYISIPMKPVSLIKMCLNETYS